MQTDTGEEKKVRVHAYCGGNLGVPKEKETRRNSEQSGLCLWCPRFYVPSGEAASAEARVPAGLVLWSRLMREA
jgi:hypothetical protein